MKKKLSAKSAFFTVRSLVAFALCLFGVVFSLIAAGIMPGSGAPSGVKRTNPKPAPATNIKMRGVASYKNDVSPPLREMNIAPMALQIECELKENPKTGIFHLDKPDGALQDHLVSLMSLQAPNIPATTLNFDGIAFPGVVCSCAPPDPNGAVGLTQYVANVNEGIQVFNKSTGASVMGPIAISTLWKNFGGVCEFNGHGDGIVLYDHFANRWLVSQFAGTGNPSDECIAISTSPDATGSYYRYGFHLGTNYFDYPHIGVWPDGYYMSMNIFNSAGTAFLGPQPFAFDRANMLVGNPATFVSPVGPLGATVDSFLPADIDGQMLPASGAPETFVDFPSAGVYNIYHFHVDFTTPANSTWTTFATPPAAAFTALCDTPNASTPTTNRNCVPQLGVTTLASGLDGIGDRPMFRAAYRNFGDHEALVTNFSVCATGACGTAGTGSGTSGVRWVELRNVTAGPVTVFQESTYQPDTTWRWLGSVAMDNGGNMAVGFSASSSTINPQIRYAGRLAGDPINTLAQGEATLFAGTGSQSSTGNRWGDYSALTVDPTDDCTFWYTNEYYSTTGQFNWRTRVGSFSFPQCVPLTPTPTAAISLQKTADNASINPGTNLGFTVTVNSSGTDTATGLSFSDNLPSGPGINWTITTPSAGWSISGSPPTQSLVYSVTSMPPSTSSSVHIQSPSSAADCGMTVTNSAMLSSSNAGSSTATASTSFDCTNCTPNAWTDNSPQLAVPANIMDQALAASGNTIYMFSGVSSGALTATSRKYDTVANTWTSIANFPAATETPVAVCDGTQYCYIMGGFNASTTARRYDTTGNTYTTLTSFATGRAAAGAVYFNGKIYLMGGLNGTTGAFITSMQIGTLSGSPPTVTWAAGAALPVGVGWPQVIQKTVGGVDYIYLTGGTATAGDQNITYRYNIGTNTWATVAGGNMPSTRWSGASGIVNGFWVLAGGYVNGSPSTSTVTYDFNANTWTTNASSMVQPRGRGAGVAVGGSLYHIGGRNDATFNGTNDNQKYTPSLCPPGLLSVVSRQTHGGAGTFDLPLSTSSVVVEPRDGTGNFTIVFNFNEPVNSGTANVTGGSVGSVNTSFSGNSMIVSMTGVNDQQTLTITVNNVTGPGEGTLSSASTQVGFLIGDVTGDSVVNVADTIVCRNAGGAVNGTNFQNDVTIDGQIDVGDTTVVRNKSGDYLP